MAADVSVAKDGLRDRLCAGVKHPGRPEEYRLSVRATCVAATGDAKRLAATKAKAQRVKRASPTDAQTRAEIKKIEREIASRYADPAELHDVRATSGVPVEFSFIILSNMIDPKRRLSTPDPIARYDEALASVKKLKGVKIDLQAIQRYMVLRATLEFLMAIVRATSSPQ